MKVVFVDVDGPLIPARCYFDGSPKFDDGTWKYDYVAVCMLKSLAKNFGIKIVYNSSHNDLGPEYIRHQATLNSLLQHLHEDFMTDFPRTTYKREEGIEKWLQAHPETTHWAAVDDFELALPNAIKIDFNIGITLNDFEKMKGLLEECKS